MSYTANTEWKEDAKDDFDEFIARRNWVSAQAIIDNFYEHGFEHEAVILRKAYLKAQYESTLPRKFPRREITQEHADRIDSHIYSKHDD